MSPTEELGSSAFAELAEIFQRVGFDDVLPVFADDYGALHDTLHLHTADVAWCPPLVARDLIRVAAADPIATIVRRGSDHYYSALVTTHGSRIRRVTDAPLARMGWVSQMSAAGYVVARDYLASCGVPLRFREERFYSTHAQLAQALLEDQVDLIATYAALREGTLVLNPTLSEARLIGAAGPIPSDVVVASRGLPRQVVLLVRDALLTAQVSPTGPLATMLNAASFAPASASHLEPLSRWVERSLGGSLRPLFALVGASHPAA
jgi:ABC-type phosphate/phosphonate transport system substrate-binding protein